MVGSMDSGSLTPLPSSSSSCGSSPPHKGSNRPSPSPSPLHKQRMDVGSLLLMVMLLLALLALQLPAVGAIQFDVGPYVTRCIMDEYAPEEESALKLRAVGRVQEGVKATVSDPEAQTVWEGPLTAAEQEVPLPEEEYGLYQICIYNGGASLQRVEVGTLERAVKLSNKDAKLTKEHLRPLQLLFRRAELTVLGVSKELDHVRQREAALRETSETTDSRIQWFSILSIVILLAVAAWQVVFLKQFFRAKKLL